MENETLAPPDAAGSDDELPPPTGTRFRMMPYVMLLAGM